VLLVPPVEFDLERENKEKKEKANLNFVFNLADELSKAGFHLLNIKLSNEKIESKKLSIQITSFSGTKNLAVDLSSIDVKNPTDANATKEVVKNIVQEIKKSSSDDQIFVELIFNPKEQKTQNTPPVQQTMSLSFFIDKSSDQKQQELSFYETADGYYIVSKSSKIDVSPIVSLKRDYIPKKEYASKTANLIKDLYNQYPNSVVVVNIPIEDINSLKENEKIKQEIEKKLENSNINYKISFISLSAKMLIEYLKNMDEKKVQDIKLGLIESQNFDQNQKEQLRSINSKEELIEFLGQNNEQYLYFAKKLRDNHPAIEEIYSDLREVRLIPLRNQQQTSGVYLKDGVLYNPQAKTLIGYLNGQYYSSTKHFQIRLEGLPFNTLKYKDLSIQNYLIEIKDSNTEKKFNESYTVYYIRKPPEIVKNEMFENSLKNFKGLVVVDPSMHVQEVFLKDNKEFQSLVKGQVPSELKEKIYVLQKDVQENYSNFFNYLNNILERYIKDKLLTSQEKNIIELIKKDGLTIIGDAAITDAVSWIDKSVAATFKERASELYKKDKVVLKVRFLVVAPEEFKFRTKSGGFDIKSQDDRLEEFSKNFGELIKLNQDSGASHYKCNLDYVKFEIVWFKPAKAESLNLKQAADYFIY
jgi:hypothetical protein